MTSHGHPVLVIDLSNVCRDDGIVPLGVPAAWSRLDLLLGAIDEASSLEYSGYYLVADKSLRHKVPKGDRRLLESLEQEGRLEFNEFADERLVELAFGSTSPFDNALLVTNDYLDDFRRSFPELQTSSAIAWTADSRGLPRPELRPFGERTHHRMSHKEEEGELHRRRLLRRSVQDEAARWRYRCNNPKCPIAAFWPDHLEELPSYDQQRESFVCPSKFCGRPLERLSKRDPAVQVVVLAEDREVARLLVENGVEIGRTDAEGCIGLERFCMREIVDAVSRRHVRVDVEGDTVRVTDLGSKNGTDLARRGDLRDTTPLRPSKKTNWQLRDAVLLPGGIRLERSGRRLPVTGEGPLTSPPTSAESTETRLATRSDQPQ